MSSLFLADFFNTETEFEARELKGKWEPFIQWDSSLVVVSGDKP